jgi:hypothetical protein
MGEGGGRVRWRDGRLAGAALSDDRLESAGGRIDHLGEVRRPDQLRSPNSLMQHDGAPAP